MFFCVGSSKWTYSRLILSLVLSAILSGIMALRTTVCCPNKCFCYGLDSTSLEKLPSFLCSVINSLVDLGIYLPFIICYYFFVYNFMVNIFFYFSLFRLLLYVFFIHFQCGLYFCLSISICCVYLRISFLLVFHESCKFALSSKFTFVCKINIRNGYFLIADI